MARFKVFYLQPGDARLDDPGEQPSIRAGFAWELFDEEDKPLGWAYGFPDETAIRLSIESVLDAAREYLGGGDGWEEVPH